MTVKEQIVEKIRAAGYDMFTACEEASRIIAEFKASGKDRMEFGVMGAHGKCVDVIAIERKKT